jgi:hypothetical protein
VPPPPHLLPLIPRPERQPPWGRAGGLRPHSRGGRRFLPDVRRNNTRLYSFGSLFLRVSNPKARKEKMNNGSPAKGLAIPLRRTSISTAAPMRRRALPHSLSLPVGVGRAIRRCAETPSIRRVSIGWKRVHGDKQVVLLGGSTPDPPRPAAETAVRYALSIERLRCAA